jgi:hypothetical protein
MAGPDCRCALPSRDQGPAPRPVPGRETAPAELARQTLRHRSGPRTRRCGKNEAARVLGLLATYHRDDLARALERAVRYRAYSWSAVERILAVQARPRSVWESLEAEAQEQLDEIFRQSPLSVRSTAEYQALLEETAPGYETDDDKDDDKDNDDEGDDPAA